MAISDPARKHLQQIVDILKQNAMHMIDVRIAEPEEDTKRATDFVITVAGGDVAVRIRALS